MRAACSALVALAVTAGCGGGGDDAVAPTLAEIQTKIFTPRCAVGTSCHGGDDPQKGLSLAAPARANIVGVASAEVAAKQLVVPGNAAASYLFEKVSAAAPQVGARMPYTNDPLSPGEIAALRAWIEQGALDD